VSSPLLACAHNRVCGHFPSPRRDRKSKCDSFSRSEKGGPRRRNTESQRSTYLISVEFQHRVQAIVEGFTYLFDGVEQEKRWFATKWARQEKEIRKIIDSTQGMYGDLQAVTGRSLPMIAALETPEAMLPEAVGTHVAAAAQ
jgi:hypothetical protein